MGFWARWIAAVKKSLDERVTGHRGEAHNGFEGLVDTETLVIRARLPGGHRGSLGLQVHPAGGQVVQASGSDLLECNLGLGSTLHGARVLIDSQLQADGQPGLAVLAVELCQPRGDHTDILESYSVESQFSAQGQATLSMTIDLG
jgi:hypothetical protein